MKITSFFTILAISLIFTHDALSLDCSHGATTSAKGNTLFLYFPTASDASFVSTIGTVTTSPLAAFDVADLDSSIGTTTQLRDRIFEFVQEDYCEFNVDVNQTTTAPTTAGIARWQIVGIGSDSHSSWFGYSALSSNANDADAQDYTRVWAASFDDVYGGTGGALNGTDSTLDRWAAAITGTTSHEAAHNYGVTHCEAGGLAGEDGPTNHIMNTGNVTGQGCSYTDTLDGEDRVSRRHFSDQSYELLAHNIGLNIMTVYNWDLINPNAEDAHELEFTLLSSASSLSISTWWNGSRSPWRDPTISSVCNNCETFQGTTYNKFTLNFSTDKAWVGGADGVLPGGAEFHIGAGFSESDLVIVYDTKLKDSGGADLTLHPRMAGFNRGAADLISGDFAMAMYNPDPDAGDMIIRDLKIQYLPRLVDINAMLVGEKMRDVRGLPIIAHGSCDPRGCKPRKDFDLKESKEFHLGKISDDRFVDIIHDSTDCTPGLTPASGVGDAISGSLIYCPEGNSLSLFPSTSVYVTATVIDPNARYFDRATMAYVNGPLESKVFYQFVGIAPDFNENGIDDLLDIRAGTSIDKNGNGIVDEVEPGQSTGGDDDPTKLPWWVYLILAILIVFILILYSRQRKSG